MLRQILPICCVACVALAASSCTAPPAPFIAPAAIPSASPRILAIDMEKMERSDASGFFVAPNLLVTCSHVISKHQPLGIVMPEGRQMTISRVEADDPASDLAIVGVDGTGTALRLSDRLPRTGEKLTALTRFGSAAAVIVGAYIDPDIGSTYLVSCPGLREGASGGALIDAGGAVVGIIRGAVEDDPQRVVAIPCQRLRALIHCNSSRPAASPM